MTDRYNPKDKLPEHGEIVVVEDHEQNPGKVFLCKWDAENEIFGLHQDSPGGWFEVDEIDYWVPTGIIKK